MKYLLVFYCFIFSLHGSAIETLEKNGEEIECLDGSSVANFLSKNPTRYALREVWEAVNEFVESCHNGELGPRNLSREEQIFSEHSHGVCQRRILSFLSAAGPTGIVSLVSYYASSNPNFVICAGLLTMGFRDVLEKNFKAFQYAIFPSENILKLDLAELKARFAVNMPSERRKKFEEDLLLARKNITRGLQAHEENRMRREIERLGHIISLPTHIKIIDQSKAKELCDEVANRMWATYDAELTKKIVMLAYQIINDASPDWEGLAKSSYYFLGKPGTGKTTIAKMIAEVLGLPFCEIDLSQTKALEIFSAAENFQPDAPVILGKVTRGFLAKDGALNTIFFIDEAHDALNPLNKYCSDYQRAFKALLDKDQAYVLDEGIKCKIDVSRAIFILAGNVVLQDVKNALGTRMTTYEFTPASKAARRIIAHQALEKAKTRFKFEPSAPIGDEDDKIFAAIIREDARFADEGVRPLQEVITKYVAFIKAQESGIMEGAHFDIGQQFVDARGPGAQEQNILELEPR